jgi:hypothetical protein
MPDQPPSQQADPSLSARNGGVPYLALGLVIVLILSLLLAAAYTVFLNPEIALYRHAASVKRQWSDNLTRYHTNKFVFCGGSSASFSIDGESILAQQGLPVVNAGMHAGMEPPFLTAFAASMAQRGDTLVVSIEPGLLMSPFSSPDLAAQMGVALGEPGLIHASPITGDPVAWLDTLCSLRPGANHTFTLLGKIALGKPLYRYQKADIQLSGWQIARDFREFEEALPGEGRLSVDARQLLVKLKEWGQKNGVRVVYSLPWGYTSLRNAEALRKVNLRFLLEMAEILPVLRDPTFGVHTQKEDFADTCWHLRAEAARKRSAQLATLLKDSLYWSTSELSSLVLSNQGHAGKN